MLYTKDTINNLDFSNYKNVYAVGCSFAKWRWASWADLIASELDTTQGEYINLGKAGAGNLYMQTIISQLINIGKLKDPDDLLVVMWSTFYREDRYLSNSWNTPGNIFTASHEFDDNYIRNYADARGMTMRDLAIIDVCQRMLEQQNFDSVCMLGVGYEQQDYYAGLESSDKCNDLYEIYQDLNVLQPDLLTFNGGEWPVHYSYKDSHSGSMFDDYHPSSLVYYDFLKQVGFPMTQKSKYIAELSHDMMSQIDSDKELQKKDWPWRDEYIGLGI